MTKDEAIQAMKKGFKVTHQYFSSDEFIYMENGRIHDENGYDLDDEFWQWRQEDYWLTGWDLYHTKK